ncbi:MAG: phosphoribosylglycinamide formyltransferase [Terrimicrobiaceae bacterium]|nr:phosphoribosylglycinamide formyltransferase [Terrimicrobiaceae bacterium]
MKWRNTRLAMNPAACMIPGAMGRLKIGVLGSGKGSNFRAILSEIQAGRLDAEAVVVLSDVETAGILDLARGAGLPAHVIREPKFRTKLSPEVEAGVVTTLREAGTELVVLAGYMRMVKAPLLAAFPRRLINIHPSLLPAFPGLEAWRQALEAGVEKTGCTVHFVDSGMDSGEIIARAEVPVLPGDTAESLHARIQVEEHKLYPGVVARFASGDLP